MCPKQILIKSASKNFTELFVSELKNIPSIRFVYHKINGLYTVAIKCSGYYEIFSNTHSSSFYGSYIYLYTSVSLLLSELIMSFYEKTLIKRFLNLNYFYFQDEEQSQIANIASSLLDSSSPLELSKNLYLKRKEKLLSYLLENFRSRNYINIEAFTNFSTPNYMYDVEETIDRAVELFLSNISYIELIQFILENWLV